MSRTHVRQLRYGAGVGGLRSWEVEQLRRSVAMLAPEAPGLQREEARDLLAQLRDALRVLERRDEPPHPPLRGGAPG